MSAQDTTGRTIELVRIDELRPATRNPKLHDLPRIIDSIREQGYVAPAVLDERTQRLVIGHGRREALLQMQTEGQAPPDGIEVDDDGAWRMPVVRGWASTDDAAAAAVIVGDNHLTELGGWDERLLADILIDVADESDQLLDLTGFTGRDLAKLLADTGDDPTQTLRGDADHLPPDAPLVARAGDLWTLGGHRLAVALPTDTTAVAALIGDRRATCMWTNVPTSDTAVEQLAQVLAVATKTLRPGAAAYLACEAGPYASRVGETIAAAWSLRQQLLWIRDRATATAGDYGARHDAIWLAYTPAGKGSGRLGRGGDHWYGDDAQNTCLEAPTPPQADLHPGLRPVAVATATLRNSAPRGGIIYDPHGGPGTVLIACQALGMRGRAVEPDPQVASRAIVRWVTLTGQTATCGDRQVTPDNLGRTAA